MRPILAALQPSFAIFAVEDFARKTAKVMPSRRHHHFYYELVGLSRRL
jgi:hypothetical protein